MLAAGCWHEPSGKGGLLVRGCWPGNTAGGDAIELSRVLDRVSGENEGRNRILAVGDPCAAASQRGAGAVARQRAEGMMSA
jgi:hypothetical protein